MYNVVLVPSAYVVTATITLCQTNISRTETKNLCYWVNAQIAGTTVTGWTMEVTVRTEE